MSSTSSLCKISRNDSSSSGSDRKSTRLNSSHLVISYAVFCWKKKEELAQLGHARVEPRRLPVERVRQPPRPVDPPEPPPDRDEHQSGATGRPVLAQVAA